MSLYASAKSFLCLWKGFGGGSIKLIPSQSVMVRCSVQWSATHLAIALFSAKQLLMILAGYRRRHPWPPPELWDWINTQWFFYY